MPQILSIFCTRDLRLRGTLKIIAINLISARPGERRVQQVQPRAPADLPLHPDPLQRRAAHRRVRHHHPRLPREATQGTI